MHDKNVNGLLKKQLEKFESMLNLEHQKKVEKTYRDIYEFKEVDQLPYIIWDASIAEDKEWPVFHYNDSFSDPVKMLLNQLYIPYLHYQLKDYHAVNIRCNYGTVIMPSIFGTKYQLTENSMPWCNHLNSREEVEKLVEKGKPNLENGLGKTCFETAEFYMDVLSDYPKLKETVKIYHPDLQGPFDVAHLIWGPDIFLALYDCPDLVHRLLSLITDTYIDWMKKWKELVNENNKFTSHWQYYMKGGIMLRDDTPILLSRQQYEEFIKPYDQRLLYEFGGGIHFCGKGDHLIELMCKCKNLYGINCYEPELNNIELLLESNLPNKIVIMGLHEKFVSSNIKTGIIVIK